MQIHISPSPETPIPVTKHRKTPAPSSKIDNIEFSNSLTTLLLTFLLTPFLYSQEKITYQDHILPILENSCTNCHNPDKKKGGLDLTSYSSTIAGGSGGKITTPGDGASSRIFLTTTHTEEPYMPPKGERLGKKELNLLRAWIDGGLLDSKDSKAKKSDIPKIAFNTPSSGKPDGPPPLPEHVLLEPVISPSTATPIHAIERSPWAPLIAVTSQRQVILYNTDTLDIAGILPFPNGEPTALSFHPSGKYLTVGGGIPGKSGTTVTYDITTGEIILTAAKEYDSIISTSIRADMQAIATGSPSKILKTWNLSDSSQEHSIKKHTDWITALTYSHDGILLASADRNGGLWVWESHSGELLHTLRGHQSRIVSLKWSADSNFLASASEDGTLRIWDMKTGNEVKKLDAHRPGILAFDWASDGHILTTGRDSRIKLWRPNYSLVKEIDTKNTLHTTAAFSQDGARFFTADYHGSIHAYDTKSLNEITTLTSIPAPLSQQIINNSKDLTTMDPKLEQLKSTLANITNQLHQTTESLNKSTQKLTKQKQQRQQIDQQINQQNNTLKNLNEQITALDQQRKEIIPQRQSTREALNQHLAQERKVTQEFNHLTNLHKQSQNQLNQLSQKALAAQSKAQANPEDQNLQNAARELTKKLTEKSNQHTELTSRTNAAKSDLAEISKQTPTLQKISTDTESKFQTTQKPWDEFINKRSNLHATLKKLHDARNTLNQSIPPLEKSIPILTKSRDELIKQKPQKEQHLKTLTEQQTHLTQKIKSLQAAQINTKRLQAKTALHTLTQQRNENLNEFTSLSKTKPTLETTHKIIDLKQQINQTTSTFQTSVKTLEQLNEQYQNALK